MKITTGAQSRSIRKAKGALIIDGRHVGDTLQCVHCAMHWQVIHGSRNRRGFCMSCCGPTCGQTKCDPCFPFQKKLEIMEKKNSNHLIL